MNSLTGATEGPDDSAAGDLADNQLRRATLGDMLRRQAHRSPKKLALVYYTATFGRNALTYSELNDRVNRAAAGFQANGIGRSSVLAILGRAGVDFVVSYYAALKLGAVVTPVSAWGTAHEIATQLSETKPSLLLVEDRYLALATNAAEIAGDDPTVITWSREVSREPKEGSLAALLAMHPVADEPATYLDEADVAMIVYTSGTEASAKGVMLQHRNFLIGTTPAWVFDEYVASSDVFLLLAPMHTMAGLGTLTSLITIGASVVLVESPKPELALRVMGAEGVTNTSQTPTFYGRLSRLPELRPKSLASLRQCHTYGGLISPSVVNTMRAAAPQVTWATYWGQSELAQLGSIGYFRDFSDVPNGDPRWIGRPVPHLDIRIVDTNDVDVEEGELICRSPSTMLGYYGDPERTAAVMRGGWLRTGDVVRRDDDGNLFFIDRRKDVIKTGGMNVSSLEVEYVLHDHPAIVEAAVVGRPDPEWSEAVTAYVVLAPNAELSVDAILRHCHDRLSSYKVPKAVHVVNELPKDPQGKTLKRELRAKVEVG